MDEPLLAILLSEQLVQVIERLGDGAEHPRAHHAKNELRTK